MNNESGALVNLPLSLPQRHSLPLRRKALKAPSLPGRLQPYPDAASLPASLFLFTGSGSGLGVQGFQRDG